MEPAIIWTSIIIPLLIGPLCLFLKSLYDRFNDTKDQRKLTQFNDIKERTQNKLKDFYWPVYIKLLCIYQMNFTIPIKPKLNAELSSMSSTNSSSSDSEDEGEPFIKYTKKKVKRCKGLYMKKQKQVRCRRVIPTNSISYCKRCLWNYNNDKPEDRQNEDTCVEISIPTHVNITTNSDNRRNDDVSLTGDGIGVVRELTMTRANIDEVTIKEFKKLIKQHHSEVLDIIENYISIAEPNNKLGKHIISFIKYSKFKAILDTSERDYNINLFGTKDNTNKLLSLIEIKLYDLQEEYKILLRKGPYEYEDNHHNISSSESDQDEEELNQEDQEDRENETRV